MSFVIFAWLFASLSVFVVVTTVLAAQGTIGPNRFVGIGSAVVRRDEATWRRAHRAAARVVVPGFGVGAIVDVLVAQETFGDWSRTAANVSILVFHLLLWGSVVVAEHAARSGALSA